jgi:hypothetical protein
LLRVVRGDPTPDELAALVTVVAARAAARRPAPQRRPAWGDPAMALGGMPIPGPDAWRRSTLVPGIRTGAGR